MDQNSTAIQLIKPDVKPPLSREQTIKAMAKAVYDERVKLWESRLGDREKVFSKRDAHALKLAKKKIADADVRIFTDGDGVTVRFDVSVSEIELGELYVAARNFAMPMKPQLDAITCEIRQKVTAQTDRVAEVLRDENLKKALAAAGEKILAKLTAA